MSCIVVFLVYFHPRDSGKLNVSIPTPVKEPKKEPARERESNSTTTSGSSSSNGMDKKTKEQLHTITQLLKNPPPVQFNKQLLDFDYGSDEEEGGDNHDPVNPATLDAIR